MNIDQITHPHMKGYSNGYRGSHGPLRHRRYYFYSDNRDRHQAGSTAISRARAAALASEDSYPHIYILP